MYTRDHGKVKGKGLKLTSSGVQGNNDEGTKVAKLKID